MRNTRGRKRQFPKSGAIEVPATSKNRYARGFRIERHAKGEVSWQES